jgi:hypothetical protein
VEARSGAVFLFFRFAYCGAARWKRKAQPDGKFTVIVIAITRRYWQVHLGRVEHDSKDEWEEVAFLLYTSQRMVIRYQRSHLCHVSRIWNKRTAKIWCVFRHLHAGTTEYFLT